MTSSLQATLQHIRALSDSEPKQGRLLERMVKAYLDEAELFATDLEWVANVTNSALRSFRENYDNDLITKDAIFNYVYGVVHSPTYRERCANDLAKGLPRVPMAPAFEAFAEAGWKACGTSPWLRDLRRISIEGRVGFT